MAVGQKVFKPDEIRKTINVLKPEGELFEVRCLEANGRKVYSGYFKSQESLIDQLCRLNSTDSNIYITLGKVKEDCYSREQREKFVMYALYSWILQNELLTDIPTKATL